MRSPTSGTHGEIAVQSVWRRAGTVKHHFLGLFANDRIIDSDDLAPGFRFGVMGVDIGDEDVGEISFVRLLGLWQTSRDRIGGNFLYWIHPVGSIPVSIVLLLNSK